MGSKTSPLQGVTFLLLLKKALYVLVPCLVVKHLPLPRPHSFHFPVLMVQDELSLEATEKIFAFCSNGNGRSKHRCVFTTWRQIHSSATSNLPCKAQGNGKLAWIFLPFQVVQKSTSLPDTIFPSIREIFKDPLNWKSSGSRRGPRHLLWGSLTQRGNGSPLIGLLIISTVFCRCKITL